MGRTPWNAALIALLAGSLLGLPAAGQTPRLVRDLEALREVRPDFLGQAWETPSGLVVAADARLWALPRPPFAPVRLLDQVDGLWPIRLDVWPQPDGRLLAGGTDPASGVRGLWLVEANGLTLLAPASELVRPNLVSPPAARRGDAFVANVATTAGQPAGLYRVSPGHEPLYLDSAAWFTDVDHFSGVWCAEIAAARSAIVSCARRPQGLVWATDGAGPRSLLWPDPGAQAFEWLTPIDGVVFGRYHGGPGTPAENGGVLRTDGTAAGTWLVGNSGTPFGEYATGNGEPLLGPLFLPFANGVVWLDRSDTQAALRWVESGGNHATVLGAGPFWRLLGAVGETLYLAGGAQGHELWAFEQRLGSRLVANLGESTVIRHFAAVGENAFAFSTSSAGEGVEVWISDGTSAGTAMLPWQPGPSWGLYDSAGLAAVSGGALVATTDNDAVGRPALLDSQGELQPLEQLVLPGNAGSHPWGLKRFTGGSIAFMAHTRQHGHRPWISDGSPSGTLPVGTQRWNLCGPDGFLPLEPGWIAECPNDDGQARVFAVMPQSQSIEIGTLALDPVVGGQRLEGARLGDHHAVIGRPFQPVRRFDLTSGGAIALTDETCGAAGDAQPIFGAIDGGILFSGCRGGVAGLFLDDGTTILELAPGLWQAGTKFGDVVVLTRAVAGTVETLVTDGSTVGTELLPVSLGLAPDTSDAGARTKTCAIHDGAAGEAEVWAFDSITRAVRWVGIASPSARLVEGPRLTWILGDWTEPDGYRSVSVCDAEAATLTTVDTAALPGRVIGATLGTLWLLDPWAEVGGPELLRIDAATGAQHVVHRARDVVGGSGPTHGLVVDDKVYVTLADPDHGRELWVVDAVGPLIFADDFESGDTSRWDP